MTSSTHPGQVAALAASAAVLAAMLTGCGNTKPEPNPAPSSSAPAPTSAQPTQKNLSPSGGNSFTPTVKATPPQTVPPGRHRY